MCDAPSIRSRRGSSGADTETDLFARVLREVFDDVAWEDVECSARRAWRHVGQITGQDWEEVRESIQHAWQTH